MTPERLTYSFIVPANAIDERNHVNNLAYLQWCMEAATKHWKQNTNSGLRDRYVWYVLRHEIDYKASSFEGEELIISTWVTFAKGVKSERCFEISRASDLQLLITAKTLWCLLDGKSLKPTKITEEIRTLFMK